MATTDKATLLGWIVTRWKPTVAQFKAFAESYWHKSEKIPTSSIEGLDSIMNGVATEEFVTNSIAQYGQGVSELIAGLSAKAGITDKTYTELATMISEGTLLAGSLYKITDRGDRGIILRAVSASQLSRDGIRIMLCPSTYATGADAHGNSWIGVWTPLKSVLFGNLAIRDGMVWRNLTSEIGNVDDKGILDPVHWELISKDSFLKSEYTEMLFGCTFDFNNDYIIRQWDDKGNVFWLDKDYDGDDFNPCNISDWNYESSGQVYRNNRCRGVFNNTTMSGIKNNSGDFSISDNYCTEYGSWIQDNVNCKGIYHNKFNAIEGNSNCSIEDNGFAIPNGAVIVGNNLIGGISNNNCSVEKNFNSGGIYNNTCVNGISQNVNIGSIHDNSCERITANGNLGQIANNSNTGIIERNLNSGSISGNQPNVTVITNNSNAGDITDNSNAGRIQGNTNVGNIDTNAVNGSIEFNTNGGSISSNSSSVGSIHHNSNAGEISQNTSAIVIGENSNAGRIYGNACSGNIWCNTNGGEIEANISGSIWYNSNTMSIDHCEILAGYICNNRNGGVIRVTSSAANNVYDNYNNGDIQGAIITNITDTRVNKP